MFTQIFSSYKKAFTGLTTQVWWLSIVIFINRAGTMVPLFLSLYLTQKKGFTLTQAGVIAAYFGAGSIIGAFVGGKLADKIGHLKVQFTALALGGVMFIALAYLNSYYTLCAMTFALGIVSDAFRPANFVAIAKYSTPETLTRSYTLNRLAVNLGWSAGASIGGFLASINYKLIFWVDGIANIIAAFVLWFLLYRNDKKLTKKKQDSTDILQEEIKENFPALSPYKDKVYLKFIVICTLYTICFILMFRIIPNYFKDDLHLNERTIGAILALNGIIIALFEMLIVSKVEGKKSNVTFIRIGCYIMIGGFACLFSPYWGFAFGILCMLFFTVSEIATLPFMNAFMMSRTSKNNKGQYASLYTASWSVALIVAPWLGGIIVDTFGYKTLWIIAIAVTIICIFLTYNLEPREKETKTKV